MSYLRKKFGRLWLVSHLNTQYIIYHPHFPEKPGVRQPVGKPRNLVAQHFPAQGV